MRFAIFLSPSEDKIIPPHTTITHNENYRDIPPKFLESLWGQEELGQHRIQAMQHYYEALRMIVQQHDRGILQSLYGAKNFNDKNLFESQVALYDATLMRSIERYSGVAFQGLAFHTLTPKSQEFLLQNVLIFSNLFGVIRAHDRIPFYKLKQGTTLENLTLQEVYAPFTPLIQDSLKEKEYVIDLRAGIYTKLFSPKQPHFFFEFQKNGKIISHYAKLYRGKILNILAQNMPNHSVDTCLEYFCSLSSNDLQFHSYTTKHNRFILRYEIS